jgi:hypothetical protein
VIHLPRPGRCLPPDGSSLVAGAETRLAQLPCIVQGARSTGVRVKRSSLSPEMQPHAGPTLLCASARMVHCDPWTNDARGRDPVCLTFARLEASGARCLPGVAPPSGARYRGHSGGMPVRRPRQRPRGLPATACHSAIASSTQRRAGGYSRTIEQPQLVQAASGRDCPSGKVTHPHVQVRLQRHRTVTPQTARWTSWDLGSRVRGSDRCADCASSADDL